MNDLDPAPDRDLDERLRRLGRALDDVAPPVSADEAANRARGGGHPRRLTPALVAAGFVVAAGLAGLAVAQRTTDTSVVAGPPDRPGSVPASTPSTVTSPSSAPFPSTSALPGERIEIYPYEGARLTAVGVAADDTLNVRTGPGTAYPVAFTLDPLADDIRATGHNRTAESGSWSEVEVAGRTGWANSSFLLQPGFVEDVTARWYPSPAQRPSATTMTALAHTVAGRAASEEPRSRVVVVDGPRSGDPAEVTVDVIGLGDDAIGGYRLHVFAERAADRFTVRTVESTVLCTRGVTDGLCS